MRYFNAELFFATVRQFCVCVRSMGNAGSGGNGSAGGIRQRFNMSPSKSCRQLMPSSIDSGPMDGSEHSPAEGEDACADFNNPVKEGAEKETACKTPSNDGTKIVDPRSPTDDITRTPIYNVGAGGGWLFDNLVFGIENLSNGRGVRTWYNIN